MIVGGSMDGLNVVFLVVRCFRLGSGLVVVAWLKIDSRVWLWWGLGRFFR